MKNQLLKSGNVKEYLRLILDELNRPADLSFSRQMMRPKSVIAAAVEALRIFSHKKSAIKDKRYSNRL